MNMHRPSHARIQPFLRQRDTWTLYLLMAAYSLTLNSISPLISLLRTEFALSYTMSSLHLSAFAMGMIGAGVVGERVVRHFGYRRTLMLGCIGLIIGTFGLAVSASPIATLSSIVLMGCIGSCLFVTLPAALAERHNGHEAMALSEVNVAGSVGAILGPFVISVGLQFGLGWRLPLMIVGVGMMMLVPLTSQLSFHDASPQVPQQSRAPRLPRTFWCYWVVIVLAVAVEFCLLAWGAEFVAQAHSLPLSSTVLMMTSFLVAMLVGRWAGSRLLAHVPPTILLMGAIVVAVIGFVVFRFSAWVPMMLIGLWLTGLGVANMYPMALSLALTVARDVRAQASARAGLASGIAILTAPLLLGAAADHIGVTQALNVVLVFVFLMLAVSEIARRGAIQVRVRMADGGETLNQATGNTVW
jgi:MFS family permease